MATGVHLRAFEPVNHAGCADQRQLVAKPAITYWFYSFYGGEKAEASNKPGSVWDNHSSGTIVTDCLKQPTRKSARDRRCETSSLTSLFGLAPGGVYRAANCYQSRGALLPHLFTLTDQGRRYIFCGTFHGLTPSRRYLAPCPKEPGLSSVSQ
jgi:hypothetical protein